MPKSLYIAEKPSVAQEFAKALKMEMRSFNGYREGEGAVVTWCGAFGDYELSGSL